VTSAIMSSRTSVEPKHTSKTVFMVTTFCLENGKKSLVLR